MPEKNEMIIIIITIKTNYTIQVKPTKLYKSELTILTTRLLPLLCIYSILYVIYVDDSP